MAVITVNNSNTSVNACEMIFVPQYNEFTLNNGYYYTVGSSQGTASNNHCSVDLSHASAVYDPNGITLTLPVTLQVSAIGPQNIYVYTYDNNDVFNANFWNSIAIWPYLNEVAEVPPAITIASTNGSQTQTLQIAVSDPNGYAYIDNTAVTITAANGNACYLQVTPYLAFNPSTYSMLWVYALVGGTYNWGGIVQIGPSGTYNGGTATATGTCTINQGQSPSPQVESAGPSPSPGSSPNVSGYPTSYQQLDLNLAVTLDPSFTGIPTIQVSATDVMGRSSPPVQAFWGPLFTLNQTSLSFTGIVGGNNPPNQSVQITNVSGNNLTWSVSADSSWLSASGGSVPIAPGGSTSFTVSAGMSGQGAGTYNGNITVTAGGSSRKIPVTLTLYVAPTISSVSSSVSNMAGDYRGNSGTLTINGQFGAGAATDPALSVTTYLNQGLNLTGSALTKSPTQLTIPYSIAPTAAGGSRTITVANSYGLVTATFSVWDPKPVISGNPAMSVTSLMAGDVPTNNITINGSGFGSHPTVQVTPVSPTNFVAVSVTSATDSQITLTLDPSNAAAVDSAGNTIAYSVSVTSYGFGTSFNAGPGQIAYSNSIPLAIQRPNPTPNISNVTPASAPAGASITISGTGFGNGLRVPQVRQGSTANVTLNGERMTVTSWQATQIVALVPSDARVGAASVVVTVGGVPSNTYTGFSVAPPPPPTPHITGLSLPQGPPQMGFVIQGSAFGSTGTVTLNGVQIPSAQVVSWSDASITVQVPTGATSGNVAVTSGQPSNGVPFTVTAPFGCGN